MSLYEGSVKKPIMTSLCFVAVAILGIFSLTKLPIDLYPDIETNTIMVMTAYPGASAADIENNLTRPLENALNAVSDLKHITSESKENISLITLEFEFGEDIDVLTNDVRDKLDMVKSELPDEAENPIIFKFSSDMIPIVLLSVQAMKVCRHCIKSSMITSPVLWPVSVESALSLSVVLPKEKYKSMWIQSNSKPIISVSKLFRRLLVLKIGIYREVRLMSVRKLIHCVCKGSLATPRK